MDSITQFALGAALGELIAGKKAGNKALLWGGIAGTIPDLDIIFSPFFSDLENLSLHRGFSHSLLFGFIAAPVFGYLAFKLYRRKAVLTLKSWMLLFFWGIFTHPLLDAFTLYGTQLFLPFSDYRVALNTISIIDPGYTLPLLAGGILTMFFRRNKPKMAITVNRAGLVICHLYLLWTIYNKYYVEQIFNAELQRQGLQTETHLSNPVLFSNLLWYCVARNDSMCYIGYFSLLQQSKNVQFQSFPRNQFLLNRISDKKGLDKLRWFCKDFFVADIKNDTLAFYDIRFGKTYLNSEGGFEETFVFYFKIPEPGKMPLQITQYVSGKDMKFGDFIRQIFHRIQYED